jgi:hypothetical protein
LQTPHNLMNSRIHDVEHFMPPRCLEDAFSPNPPQLTCSLFAVVANLLFTSTPLAMQKRHKSCDLAPCFVATEHDLMNLTEYLNGLAPEVIKAGIIKITVPEELRVKLLPCSKPSRAEFPCKVQVMRCSSKHEAPGSANLVGHHYGHSTTVEKLKTYTEKTKASYR